MKTIKFLFSLIAFAFISNANADRIQYTYDASGNRIQAQRQILLRDSEGDSDRERNPMFHELTNYRITIYPNPTEGRFCVEITGTETFENSSMTIYNISGNIIYYNAQPEAVNDIDMTICPNGLYLLVIRVDGETSSWKIIKI